MNAIEKTYTDALSQVESLAPDESVEFAKGKITRHEPLSSAETPVYSTHTKSSCGGAVGARTALYAVGITPPLGVGDGVTVNYWSDRAPFTVVHVSPSGKTATIQRDLVKFVSGNFQEGNAVFEHARNPNGRTETVRVRKNGLWYPAGKSSNVLSLGRSYYQDPTF